VAGTVMYVADTNNQRIQAFGMGACIKPAG
jgi:hypothetical protein